MIIIIYCCYYVLWSNNANSVKMLETHKKYEKKIRKGDFGTHSHATHWTCRLCYYMVAISLIKPIKSSVDEWVRVLLFSR